MAKKFENDPRVGFFIGDMCDTEWLYRALDGVDSVVHAAATKIPPVINNWGLSSERIKNSKVVLGNFIYDSETNTD